MSNSEIKNREKEVEFVSEKIQDIQTAGYLMCLKVTNPIRAHSLMNFFLISEQVGEVLKSEFPSLEAVELTKYKYDVGL